MTVSSFLSLLVVWLTANVSPGPDIAQVIRLGVHSRKAGIFGGLGINTGAAIWITGSLLGLSALVNTHPGVLTFLQLIGGSYLMWMGFGALRAGLSPQREQAAEQEELSGEISALRAWLTGTATNLSNPKALLFFGAVFAQFITPGMGWEWHAIILVVLLSTGIAWFTVLAIAVDTISEKLVRNARIIDAVTGVVFMGLAAWMLIDAASALLSGA
ncbi:hypothetical protein B842_00620 [Corynebacterium humireducens NBRC 106098 = DSM 45392]|uniref:Threonine efflux protein n=1 Tax=Corynebacterium humireducens NBRC 106098 = DSM 45392 TaxID=1223515 RepID=A0A0B5CZP9_9CORY|nr:LysE family translocator [Corynebacterium humireducens]AJE31980.1 hypothetical protein B842_00620 [Corynebacterium humireducens NBRC 106098 = DSM 45392]